MKKQLILMLVLVIGITVFTGCEPTNLNNEVNSDTGELAMYISDAPVNDIESVYVTLDKIEIKNEDKDNWETLRDFDVDNGEGQFDLLDLRFSRDVLGQKSLTTGTYNQIRLIVASDTINQKTGEMTNKFTDKSYVEFKDGSTEELFIPSGVQTGIKITKNFEIRKDIITELTLDINVKDVIHSAGKSGKIIMNPATAIDLIVDHKTGNLKGRATDGNGEPFTTKADDVNIDILNKEGEVIKSTLASTEKDSKTDEPAGSFLIRGLKEGTYTLKAYLADDDGNINPEYNMKTIENIKITAGETNTLDSIIKLSFIPR